MSGMRLAPDQVSLWSSMLDYNASIVAHLANRLDAADMQYATAIVLPEARARFVVARAFVRTVLGRAIGAAPASLEFARGLHGKPYLPGISISFSLSHTSSTALLAVASEGNV